MNINGYSSNLKMEVKMKAKIKFLGGSVGKITGSCYLIEVEATSNSKAINILVDIGLIQGNFIESLNKNREILDFINPSDINFVLLTHAHVDHIGRLPLLYVHGFRGSVICTDSTARLLTPMLEDSAKIQIHEAASINNRLKKSKNEHEKLDSSLLAGGAYDKRKQKKRDKNNGSQEICKPLYETSDVIKVCKLVRINKYHQDIELAPKIIAKMYQSGHVIGGSIITLKIGAKMICFTGDLGRKDGIILPPPEIVKEKINYLVIESTYGDRIHPPRDKEAKLLIELVKDGFDYKKKIIIPSFALERTQEIIYILSNYMHSNIIDSMMIYLDSPLAQKITKAFSRSWDLGMFEDQSIIPFNPFNPDTNPYLEIVDKKTMSDDLVNKSGPYIVIAGSGMCDSGRVREHLRANLSKDNVVVMLVGYQAKESLGARLKNGLPIRMNDEAITVKALIQSFESFSAHADGLFLLEYAKSVLARNSKVFLVHGEQDSAQQLKINMNEYISKTEVFIPKINTEFTL